MSSIVIEDVTEMEDIISQARIKLKLDSTTPTSKVFSEGFEIVLQEITFGIGTKNPEQAQNMRLSVLNDIDLTATNEKTYQLAHRVGAAYLMHGEIKKAETVLTQALGGITKIHGELHPEVLKVCVTLGTVYESSGAYKKAIALASRVLKAMEEQLGSTHRDTINSVTNVAGLLQHVGDVKQAEDMYQRAKTGFEDICKENDIAPDDDLDYVTCLGNFAILLEKKSNDETNQTVALSYYKRALRGKEKILGETNADTLRSLSNLAMLLEGQGALAEAEEMFTKCLTHRIATLGINHVETLSSKSAVAGCMLKTKRNEQACVLYKEVVQGYAKSTSQHSPMALQAAADLAYALMSSDQMEEALELYKQVSGLRLATLGASHPMTLKSFFDTGLLLFQVDQNEESIKMLKAAESGYITAKMKKDAIRCQGLIQHIETSMKEA